MDKLKTTSVSFMDILLNANNLKEITFDGGWEYFSASISLIEYPKGRSEAYSLYMCKADILALSRDLVSEFEIEKGV